jgi:hypothetical protein
MNISIYYIHPKEDAGSVTNREYMKKSRTRKL